MDVPIAALYSNLRCRVGGILLGFPVGLSRPGKSREDPGPRQDRN